jgi:subtilisin family serine protease
VRKVVVILVLVLAGLSFGVISPSLQQHLTAAKAEQKLPVHIVLKEQFDKELLNNLVDGMPKPQRRVEAARILKEFSAQQQAGVLGYLATTDASNVQSFWVVNAVYCEATPVVIRCLSERSEVSYVNYDRVYCPDLPEPEQQLGGGTEEIAWGVDKINAPAVWALGYTGQGIICGHIDTGCNYNHPDLADHMWTDPNYPHHGWNFELNNDDPMDQHSHGTHTAGTVAGDGTGGTQTGVAPDAQIMICRVKNGVDSAGQSQMWAAVQFIVSPPLSPANGADLYTMSMGWAISWGPDQSTWRTLANNVNAAGLSQIVAAGNERGSYSPPTALRCPGNVPPPWWNPQNTGTGALSGIVSIGATDENDTIAYFSSPGPVTWSSVSPFNDYAYPPGLTRPDVSAPGTNIKSLDYSGSGYALMDGTSMATPHVAGTVCLMLSKNPDLSPAEVDSILEVTSVDRGAAGKDNDFGAGRIDALAAVNYVTVAPGPKLKLSSTRINDSTGNNNGILDPGETAKLLATLRNSGGASCNSVTGKLRSYDSRLTVIDSSGSWGDIPHGGTGTNTSDPFVLHADAAINPGTTFTCSLFVSGDSAVLYSTRLQVKLVVGMQPGTIIWGPKPCPNMPTTPGLYGVTYNTDDDLIYCTNFNQSTIYKYSSDSMLTQHGTITGPADSCTDIDYTNAGAFWLVCNPQKRMYRISPSGSVVHQFSLSFEGYPIGVTEYEATHQLFTSDRRTTPYARQLVYVTDTLGNLQASITHPLDGPYGTRCLALDGRAPTNAPSLLNIWAWYDSLGNGVDSFGMYELDRVGETLLNGYVFPTKTWDVRGIECDPRDGSYWITIMKGGSSNNMIMKVAGFNFGKVGVEEPATRLPGTADRLVVLAQPNPFTGSTSLSLNLPAAGKVDVRVYYNDGRLARALADDVTVGTRAAFKWDGRDEEGQTVAPGVYFYRVQSATAQAWGKVILSR